jgi:hypothetical protein
MKNGSLQPAWKAENAAKARAVISLATWAECGPKGCEPSICDGRSRATLAVNKTVERPVPRKP